MFISILLVAIPGFVFGHDNCHFDLGSCSDPSITYGFNLSASQRWGYQPANPTDFPHGWSPDIATIESFICNRLESPCNAPPDTVAACRGAFIDLSGLSEDNAVNAWNDALRLTNQPNADGSCNTPVAFPPSFATTTTTTVYSIEPANTPLTTLTLTTQTTYTSTYTDYFSTTYPIPPASSTLTITLTLPASSITTPNNDSNTSTLTTTNTNVYYTVTTTSVTATAAGVGSSETTNSQGTATGQGGDAGGGSPFDSGAANFPATGLTRRLAFLVLTIWIFR